MRHLTFRKRLSLTLPTLGLLCACQSAPDAQTATPDAPIRARATTTALPEVTTFPTGTVVKYFDRGVLSELETPYGPLRLLRVAGTARDMGYQYGRLVGADIPETWSALVRYMAEEMGMSEKQAERALGPLLDKAWKHMEPFVSGPFQDEIQGITDGARDEGVTYLGPDGSDLSTVLKRFIALSNTSDLNAFNEGSQAVLKMLTSGTSDELDAWYRDRSRMRTGREQSEAGKMLGRTCSFFAAWGSRAEDGRLYASRNLDWATDTGIQMNAMVTIYEPDDGYAHATFGYAGFVGALAGLNEHGVAVSEVGSNSVLEKLKGQPWSLKLREILAKADSFDAAVPFMTNTHPDGVNRPTTLGYNFMVAWGDPRGRGADAQAAAFETNGALMSVFHKDADCQEKPSLHTFGRDGSHDESWEYGGHTLVNMESATKEIDAEGNIRRFRVDSSGNYVRDAQGYLIDDPYGQPLAVGKPLSCAIYRGDEAMGYGARRYQTASNGPSGDDPREVMFDSGSYTERYLSMYGYLNALASGSGYSFNGVSWVDPGEALRQVGMDEATDIARLAAMDANVMSVVYDATELKVRLAYESGSGAGWTRAADNDYVEIDLAELFSWQ